MDVERDVAAHYTHGSLERALLDGLAAAGKDPGRLKAEDLSAVDEFHIGGRPATADLADLMELSPGMRLLDVGCGIGGPSRYFAGERGAKVTGIDLTEEYVRTAAALSRMVGLDASTEYRTGSALDLPFEAGAFDGAYMLHVGMNIADKATLFRGIRRVVAAGGVFAVYDVMRIGEGDLSYPVPWSTTPATSFVDTTDTYRRLLRAAGFDVLHERVRRGFAIEFFRRMRERMAASGPPAIGLHVVMGATAPQKIANMVTAIGAGLIAPTEMVCRAV